MGRLKDWSAKLKAISESQIEEGLLKIVRETSGDAVILNVSQLLIGQDSKGKSLGRYKSRAYAELKLILNPLGVVDLRLSGNFQNGMFLQASKFPATFSSTDSKTGLLTDHYGNDIFGLQKQNKVEYAQETKPRVQRLFRGLMEVP